MATLQVLYKVKTAKLFDKSRCRSPDENDDPFAVQHLEMCRESRLLVVSGITHIMLFRFSKQEASVEPTVSESSRAAVTVCVMEVSVAVVHTRLCLVFVFRLEHTWFVPSRLGVFSSFLQIDSKQREREGFLLASLFLGLFAVLN